MPIFSYENEISFTCKLNSFSGEWLCTTPRFDFGNGLLQEGDSHANRMGVRTFLGLTRGFGTFKDVQLEKVHSRSFCGTF